MPRIKKRSQVEADLIEALGEVLADVRGEIDLPKHRPVTIARKRLGMSQDEFARFLGIPASTLRKWERGAREPTGAARALLTVIKHEPDAVRQAIAKEAAHARA